VTLKGHFCYWIPHRDKYLKMATCISCENYYSWQSCLSHLFCCCIWNVHGHLWPQVPTSGNMSETVQDKDIVAVAALANKKICIAPLPLTSSNLWPRAGSGAVSKWVICACDSLVDFGALWICLICIFVLLTFPICIFPSTFFMRLLFLLLSLTFQNIGPAPFPGWRS